MNIIEENSETKYCKSCFEEIKSSAIVCKYCGTYQNKFKRNLFFWANIFALFLSCIAIFGLIINLVHSTKKIKNRIALELIALEGNESLNVIFLNNSGKYFYLKQENIQFEIVNKLDGRFTLIEAELDGKNETNILSESTVLNFEIKPKRSNSLIDYNISQTDTISCKIEFLLIYDGNKSLSKTIKSGITSKKMKDILDSFHIEKGS